MYILSGDIGGTNTRLMLSQISELTNRRIIHVAHYKNSDHIDFPSLVRAFLIESKIALPQIASTCFGVAGPIINGSVKITNLPWFISEDEIKKHLTNSHVSLINDFTAIGYGLETLKKDELLILQQGKHQANAPIGFIGAGTGLGMGFMTKNNGNYNVYPTEGGHVNFAPIDEIQIDLLRYLNKKYHRVSVERFLSGPGLANIYNYVRDNKIYGEEENPYLRYIIQGKSNADIVANIAEYATKHKDVMAMRAMDIFIKIYASTVGNFALTFLPYGGLYIVGGIAPKLLSQIQHPSFLATFGDKGRMSGLLNEIPLFVVLNTDVGLNGAMVFAEKNLQ